MQQFYKVGSKNMDTLKLAVKILPSYMYMALEGPY